MARFLPLALLTLALASFAGCAGNDCQQLCKEIANYWEECGIDYDSSQVSDCRKDFADTNAEDDKYDNYARSCRQLMATTKDSEGQRVSKLRARFDCTQMEAGPGGAFGG